MTATLLQNCRDWLDALLGFCYPNVCQLCRAESATAEQGYVCSLCFKQVKFIQEPFCKKCGLPFPGDLTTPFQCSNCHELKLHFHFARSAVAAKGLVRDVLHQYKYNRALWFEPFLVELFLRKAVPQLNPAHWDFIVPVPLHSQKQRQREFNQAERLARHLSKATGIPMQPRLIQRNAPTRTQTLLTRSQRAANVQNAFSLRSKGKLRGARIILVDDVLTTGSTASACAKVLRRNGSGLICVWTVARGL